jgi:PrtD family type I secretion system ABC transporter
MKQTLPLQVRNRLRAYLSVTLAFSFASNVLLLVSPLYMLQVYDRVLGSGSTDTLIWLTILAVFLLCIYGAAEAGRRRTVALAGAELEKLIAPKVFARFEQENGATPHLSQDLARLSRVQSMLQTGAVLPFFDLPFAPLFVVVLFLIHPLLGALGIIGAVIVFSIAVTAELTTRQSSSFSQTALNTANEFGTGLERQRSAMVAMGLMIPAFVKWRATKDVGQEHALAASRDDSKFTAISRSSRQILQVFVLGGGAALALTQQISPGAIVASSIILARALGPIDQMVGGWRNTILAWRSWKELSERLADIDEAAEFMPLPRPKAELLIDRLAVSVPGASDPLIRPFSYTATGGQVIALAGGNGAGKTTLLQTLAGAWPPGAGSISLGGRNLHDWPSGDRGRYVGYVPQDIELLPANVADNISRLKTADAELVIEAARAAGAHDVIMALPDGYDTKVGPGGTHLSAGQRQLIGLARALFGKPVLLLLDEPTANLDAAAAPALISAIQTARDEGAIILASSHDRRLIEVAETVLLVRSGAVMAAPAEQYLKLATGPGAGVPGGQGAVG